MKQKLKKKNKADNADFGQKFIAEQNYAEQGIVLEDPFKEIPGYIEEEGITSTEEEEEETDNNETKNEE